VSKAFTPSAIERLRPRVQQLVGDVLDRAAERGEVELVDELAFPVPFQVISDLLAMPTDRSAELRDWSQTLTATLEPTATAEELDRGLEARDAVAAYLAEVIDARRADLGDDVLSALIALEEDGDRLSHLELISFVLLLYVAGHETTVNLIGNGTLALLRNRDQLALWRDDPGLGAAAVDELLRYDGPVQLTARTPFHDVTYAGAAGEPVVLEARSTVFCVLGAADHDPEAFDDPHRLDLRRPNAARHLAFSAGIHYCLGAALARLEAEEAIGMLIRRFPTIEMTAEPEWRDRLTIRGVSRLQLRVA
jgi:cytochrome P450